MREKLKILAVDDDQPMLRTICDILRIKGYECLPVDSGEKAVQAVHLEEFDCVLMDIKMAGIDGVTTLMLIKAVTPDTPVVLMSANARPEQIAAAKRYGAVTILTKPIDFPQVLSFLTGLRKEESGEE
ncbi:MAG: response regulator [Desulfuromonadales bacterium]|nr:response regulator [Desulfuromonadales bacterium]